MRRKERAFWCAVFVVTVVLLNLGFCAMQYREYRQKLDLVYQAAAAGAEGQDTLSWAVGVLKNGVTKEPAGQIPEQLLAYGYDRTYRDAMWRVCVHNCFLTAVGSGVLVLLFLMYLWRRSALCKKSNECEREKLSRQIFLLRRGDYAQVEPSDLLDESELTSLAEQMKLVTEQAAREKEETKKLVTDISHQLRTPLAALRTSVDILQGGKLTSEEHEEFVNRCSHQLARLEELASALVSISRMETGMIQIRLVRAPIFDTILQAVNRIYPKALEKRIDISLEEGGETKEMLLQQDVRWLSEAFINILENAVKYSDPDGTITITTERLQTFLRIEFADQGIGIPRQERHRVFQRFYRGESARVQQENGSGVGLYLTRKIIEQHYGTIRVTDAPEGSGSVFVVQLPYI